MGDALRPGNRTAKGRFAKGHSGNPGGLPTIVAECKSLALSHCPRAIERLSELIESSDERVAVAAATAILDRGIGKPAQPVEVHDAREHGVHEQITALRQSERGAHLLELAEAIAATQQTAGES